MKKKLAATLSVVLILGLAALGILAYLTDTDENVNVMTLGNVSIEQIEQELDENDNLVDFTQNKPLYPSTSVDKIVSVKNTGKSEAYVRTWFAFEGDAESIKKIVINKNTDGVTWTDPVVVTIGEKEYNVMCATYNEPVAPGAKTPVSLNGVTMDASAENDDVAKFGDKYEILVFSQAGQVNGFEGVSAVEALNTMFETSHPWNADVITADAAKAADFIENGEGSIIYSGDEDVIIDELTTINSNKKIVFSASDAEVRLEDTVFVSEGSTVELVGAEIIAEDNEGLIADNGGTLILGEGTSVENGYLLATGTGCKIVLDGAKITGTSTNTDVITVAAGAEVVIEEGTVISGNNVTGTNNQASLIEVGGTLTMNGGVITDNSFKGKMLVALNNGGKFYMNGGEIKNNIYAGTTFAGIVGNPIPGSDVVIEINDGDITGNKFPNGNDSCAVIYTAMITGSNIMINGGTIDAGTVNAVYANSAADLTINESTATVIGNIKFR